MKRIALLAAAAALFLPGTPGASAAEATCPAAATTTTCIDLNGVCQGHSLPQQCCVRQYVLGWWVEVCEPF
jgi:hypothetical protein